MEREEALLLRNRVAQSQGLDQGSRDRRGAGYLRSEDGVASGKADGESMAKVM